jgi:hypothetical protein
MVECEADAVARSKVGVTANVSPEEGLKQAEPVQLADCETSRLSERTTLVPLTVIGAGKLTVTWESGVYPYAKVELDEVPSGFPPEQVKDSGPIVAVAETYVSSGTLAVNSGSGFPFR